MNSKQEIKCPHCNKSFPIQEGFKHQAEELRKKLEAEENQKTATGTIRKPKESNMNDKKTIGKPKENNRKTIYENTHENIRKP